MFRITRLTDSRWYGSGINERIGAFISGVLVLIILLITATQAVCYWIPGWWRNEYSKYNTPQYVTGEMSLDDAVYITEEMLEYCIGRRDSLDDVEATIDGKTVPFFTEREKLHLEDCRNVFSGAIRLRAVSALVTAGLLFAVYYSIRRRKEKESGGYSPDSEKYDPWPEMARILARGYYLALVFVLLLAIIIIIIGLSDFTDLFTKFHHVFFDNDLWILDPHVDNLVNVMQESVFSDAAVTIGCLWAGSAAVLAVISAFISRKAS